MLLVGDNNCATIILLWLSLLVNMYVFCFVLFCLLFGYGVGFTCVCVGPQHKKNHVIIDSMN